MFSENKEYENVLASIIILIYGHGFKEELLTEDFSSQIAQYNEIHKNSINLKNVSLNDIILTQHEKILKALGRIVLDEESTHKFEYTIYNIVKTVVWTNEYIVQFMYALYLLFVENFWHQNFLDFIPDWNSIDINKKGQILKALLNCFNTETEASNIFSLNEEIENELNQISSWIKKKPYFDDRLLKNDFIYFNKESEKIVTEEINKKFDIKLKYDLDNVNTCLSEKLESVFGNCTDELKEIEGTSLYINPMIFNNAFTNEKTLADRVYSSLITYIELYLEETLPNVTLSFDLDGVKTLLGAIEKYPTDARNYTFSMDWGLTEEVRNSYEYKQLTEKEKQIDFIKTIDITERLFINTGNFIFRFKIDKINTRTLNNHELDKYAENFRAAGGLYNINSAFLNKSEAIRLIEKSYQVISYNVVFKTLINQESGFLIKFDLSKTLNKRKKH